MKKFMLIVLLCSCFLKGSTQTNLRPELDKFIGTWLYTNGNTSVTLNLKKVTYYFKSDNTTEEILMGSHNYIKNGVLVEDNLSIFSQIGQNLKGSFFIYTYNGNTELNKVFGQVSDPIHHTYQKVEMVYNSNTPATITLNMVGGPDVYINPVVEPGITLPTNFTLVKQ